MPAAELKHGPIALIDEEVPVIVLAPSDGLFDKAVSNMQEVMARDGKVLLVSDATGRAPPVQGVAAWYAGLRPVRGADPLRGAGAAPRLPIGVFKGTDVDQPRNLAKTVTVE